MRRWINRSLLLVVVLGFLAPGAAHASGGAATAASASSLRFWSPVVISASGGQHLPDYAPAVVRSGVDLEDGRNEQGGGLKLDLDGTGPTTRSIPPCSSPAGCIDTGVVAHTFSSSTFASSAPPLRSA